MAPRLTSNTVAFVSLMDSRPRSADDRFALYRPSKGRLSLEPRGPSSCQPDTLGASLRGLRFRRSSVSKLLAAMCGRLVPLFFLLRSVSWSGECPEEYKASGSTGGGRPEPNPVGRPKLDADIRLSRLETSSSRLFAPLALGEGALACTGLGDATAIATLDFQRGRRMTVRGGR